MGHLTDRVIVVTGAARGIGRAHADYLASQGAKVIVNDLGTDVTGHGQELTAAQAAVDTIIASGGTAVADTHDISTDADKVVETAIATYGRIDGIVNNAGITSNIAIDEVTLDQFNLAIGTHLYGTFGLIKAAWPHMRKQGFGRIVNTSSAAIFGVGTATGYATAKAAIIGLTRTTAADGAPFDIKVNAILPLGYSRMADTQAGLSDFMKQWYPADMISPFVASLLTAAAPCTGEAFAVGGGRAARVFIGTVPGLIGFKTIDDVLDGFDRVLAMEGSIAPTSMDEEMGFEMTQLGVDLSQFAVDLSELGTAE